MKKVLKILTLVMLIFTIWKIADTYAKYFASAQTLTLSQQLGKWVININNTPIYSEDGASVEFEVDTINNFSNTNATATKISPGSEGYAEIIIAPKGTEVAVRYDIEIDFTSLSNLAMEARLEMASGETLIKTGENTYSGTISLEDVQAEKTADLRCYIIWENDENNNEADSELGSVKGRTFNIPAKVTVTQYLGEELTPYVEPEEPEE